MKGKYKVDYYSRLSSEVYDIDKYIGLSFGDVEFYYDKLASCNGSIIDIILQRLIQFNYPLKCSA